MKFGTKYLIIGLSGLFIMCGSDSAKDWTEKIAGAMCDKMMTCMHESLEGQPEEVRKQSQVGMPSVEECVIQTTKQMGTKEDATLSSEEVGYAKSCLDEIDQLKCTQETAGQLSACMKLGKALESK